jgi:zinc transporter, ZIP family
MLPLLLTLTTAVSTLMGGWIAVRETASCACPPWLWSGRLARGKLFDLLPEALMAAARQGWSNRATLALPVLGFLLFYGADRFLETHICPTGDCEAEARRRIGKMSAVGLIAHSALDGASIAAATLVSWRIGLIVALGIVAHDLSDGLNTMLLVTRGELAGPREYRFLFADALAPVLGGVVLFESKISVQGLTVFLGVTAGSFLFTATDDLLPEAHRRSPSIAVPMATLGGVLFIALSIGFVSTLG